MTNTLSYEDMQQVCRSVHPYERYFTTICPFHNDTGPSLLVFKDGFFRCLGCNRVGSWMTLWNKLKGQPVQLMPEKKTRWDRPNIQSQDDLEEVCYKAHDNLLDFPSLGWYLDIRGISDRIETNELGYWDGWYTIPVMNNEGNFVTAVFRAAPHIQMATGLRYWCKHKPTMFVPDWRLLDKEDYIIVVFGMFDALALSSLRFPVVTTTGGQEHFNPLWLEDYRKMIYILPDRGEETAGTKLANALGWRGKRITLDYPPGTKDPADYVAQGRRTELYAQIGGQLHAGH